MDPAVAGTSAWWGGDKGDGIAPRMGGSEGATGLVAGDGGKRGAGCVTPGRRLGRKAIRSERGAGDPRDGAIPQTGGKGAPPYRRADLGVLKDREGSCGGGFQEAVGGGRDESVVWLVRGWLVERPTKRGRVPGERRLGWEWRGEFFGGTGCGGNALQSWGRCPDVGGRPG